MQIQFVLPLCRNIALKEAHPVRLKKIYIVHAAWFGETLHNWPALRSNQFYLRSIKQ